MLVFWKARLVVLAVPKTGTTAMEAALRPHADTAILNPPAQKHCNVRRFHRELAPFFQRNTHRPLELMAVMREPVSWLSSWHRYRSRPALSGHKNSTEGVDFEAFVSAWLESEPPPYAQVGRQSRFLTRPDGSLGVDHLFRHDRLDDAIQFLSGRLDIAIDMPRRNVSPLGQSQLSPALTSRLQTQAHEDFTLWNQLVERRP